jgi:hypothetical protein
LAHHHAGAPARISLSYHGCRIVGPRCSADPGIAAEARDGDVRLLPPRRVRRRGHTRGHIVYFFPRRDRVRRRPLFLGCGASSKARPRRCRRSRRSWLEHPRLVRPQYHLIGRRFARPSARQPRAERRGV